MRYAALAVVLVGLAAAVAVVGARRLPDAAARRGHWQAVLMAGGVLVVLTAVFDNLMIAAELYEYGAEGTTGIVLGLAPIEDFSYPLACALGIPGMWLIATRTREGDARG